MKKNSMEIQLPNMEVYFAEELQELDGATIYVRGNVIEIYSEQRNFLGRGQSIAGEVIQCVVKNLKEKGDVL